MRSKGAGLPSTKGASLLLSIALLLGLACTCSIPAIEFSLPIPSIASSTPLPSHWEAPGVESTERPESTEPPTPSPTSDGRNPPSPPTITPTELPPPQGGGEWGRITQSDLAITNIEANLVGHVILELYNYGPDDFADTLRYVCIGNGLRREDAPPSLPPEDPINVEFEHVRSMRQGETGGIALWADMDFDHYNYGVACSIDAGEHDPNILNNGIMGSLP